MDENHSQEPGIEPEDTEAEPVAEEAPEQETSPHAPPRRNRFVNELLDWARSILIAIALALIIKATIVQAYVIPTGSMKPTIMEGDRVFGNRFIYYFHKPERGDIIAFKPPPGVTNDSVPFLKRVIAVEGDIVEIRSGNHVFINGKLLDEPFASFDRRNQMPAMPPATVPEGHVFVLGDNRGNSYDSSHWQDKGLSPFVSDDDVQAKAFFRFWPLDRIGKL